MPINRSVKPRVVVIGGGFAGLHVAKRLRNAPVSILLIDRHNFHLFQPLLYQVATAELEPANIAAPIRSILRKQRNVEVAMGEVTKVDLAAKRVEFDGGAVTCEYLVLACGARQSYFGHDEYAARAPGLKTIDDALEIRRRILLAFETAELEADATARRAKLTFVVVGGGPTGVELAGAIKDVASATLPKEFHRIGHETAHVILVHGGDRLLPPMPQDLSRKATAVLEKLGVEIRLHSRVTDVNDAGVMIGDEQICAENVFWAAGVQGQGFLSALGVEQDRSGRIVVGTDLAIPDHPNVFVVGDAAKAVDAETNTPVPGVAQGAIQMGRFVADIIANEVRRGANFRRPVFTYYDKGSMAMIGRGNAVAAVGKRHFSGLAGWLAWGGVHAMFLVGFGNRLATINGWFWDYVLRRRRVRLITGAPQVYVKQLDTGDPTDSPTKNA